jgi:hypothetical protein
MLSGLKYSIRPTLYSSKLIANTGFVQIKNIKIVVTLLPHLLFQRCCSCKNRGDLIVVAHCYIKNIQLNENTRSIINKFWVLKKNWLNETFEKSFNDYYNKENNNRNIMNYLNKISNTDLNLSLNQ